MPECHLLAATRCGTPFAFCERTIKIQEHCSKRQVSHCTGTKRASRRVRMTPRWSAYVTDGDALVGLLHGGTRRATRIRAWSDSSRGTKILTYGSLGGLRFCTSGQAPSHCLNMAYQTSRLCLDFTIKANLWQAKDTLAINSGEICAYTCKYDHHTSVIPNAEPTSNARGQDFCPEPHRALTNTATHFSTCRHDPNCSAQEWNCDVIAAPVSWIMQTRSNKKKGWISAVYCHPPPCYTADVRECSRSYASVNDKARMFYDISIKADKFCRWSVLTDDQQMCLPISFRSVTCLICWAQVCPIGSSTSNTSDSAFFIVMTMRQYFQHIVTCFIIINPDCCSTTLTKGNTCTVNQLS